MRQRRSLPWRGPRGFQLCQHLTGDEQHDPGDQHPERGIFEEISPFVLRGVERIFEEIRIRKVHAPPGFLISSGLGASPGLPDLAAWPVPFFCESALFSGLGDLHWPASEISDAMSPCPLQDPYIPRF